LKSQQHNLSAKERLTLAIEGKTVDRLSFSPVLAYFWEHLPQKIQQAGQLEFHHLIGADPLWRGAPCPVKVNYPNVEIRTNRTGDQILTETITPVGNLRQIHQKSDAGNTEFLIEHPLKSENDIKIQTWIEENCEFKMNLKLLEPHFQGIGQEGLSIGMLLPRSKSAFQALIEHYIGTEELIYALVDFPDTIETLWKTMVQSDLKAVQLALEAEYDYFLTWEDSSTQNYSPTQYSKYIATEITQWCQILAQNGKKYIQHACGHVDQLLLPMKESGVFAIESISPPPTGNVTLSDARQKVGQDFGIIGGIEPTEFLNKPLNQLADYVHQVIADGIGGPFILSNSDSCPPGVSIEKFKLVAEIARNYVI